jgi:hypothetical protein
MRVRSVLVIAWFVAPLAACSGGVAFGTHATRPMSPADGAGAYEVAGGPVDEAPRVPGPEMTANDPRVHPVLFHAGPTSTPTPIPTTPVWPPPPLLPR